MTKIKTSDLIDLALDWAVAKCEFARYVEQNDPIKPWVQQRHDEGDPCMNPSTDWSQGGPIIEREGITVSKEDGCWSAYFRDNLFEDDGSEHWQTGPTPLIAAMRCFVASKLGDEVDVPDELISQE